MTANQLQYWKNLETERSNRAQEALIPSQINENLANARLNEAKAQVEMLNQILRDWDIKSAPFKLTQEQELAKQALSNTASQLMDLELQKAEQFGKLADARIYREGMEDEDYWTWVAGNRLANNAIRSLFGGLFG